METLTLSRKEAPRPGLIKAALEGKVTVHEAARALGVTPRQVRRLKACFRREGARGMQHHNRGRPSEKRLPRKLCEEVARLIRGTYAGFNDCHVTEKLREIEGLPVCRESVRRIRRALGLSPKRRRRAPQHHHRRLPEARLGALVQIDGSPFDWLEGRGPEMCLHGAIDDATSRILALHFRPTEDLHGYAQIFHSVFTRHGLPLAFYGDRTSILVRSDSHWTLEEELQGSRNPTQMGAVLRELGIGYVAAHCPQGKGRVENRWGTLQDRLVSEFRLRGIDTPPLAQAYLPEFLEDFNGRFARAAREPKSAFRSCPRSRIEHALCCRYTRIVARDNTASVGSRWIQIPPGPYRRSYAGLKVEVRELLDGRMLALHEGKILASQDAPEGPFALAPRNSRHRRIWAKQSTPPKIASLKSPRNDDRSSTRGSTPPPKHVSTKPGEKHPWNKGLPPKPPTYLEREDIFT